MIRTESVLWEPMKWFIGSEDEEQRSGSKSFQGITSQSAWEREEEKRKFSHLGWPVRCWGLVFSSPAGDFGWTSLLWKEVCIWCVCIWMAHVRVEHLSRERLHAKRPNAKGECREMAVYVLTRYIPECWVRSKRRLLQVNQSSFPVLPPSGVFTLCPLWYSDEKMKNSPSFLLCFKRKHTKPYHYPAKMCLGSNEWNRSLNTI